MPTMLVAAIMTIFHIFKTFHKHELNRGNCIKNRDHFILDAIQMCVCACILNHFNELNYLKNVCKTLIKLKVSDRVDFKCIKFDSFR